MSLSEPEFRSLCRDAGRNLKLFDPDGMSVGNNFYLHDVTCHVFFSEFRESAFLKFALGDPEPHCEADVYRQLMEIQLPLFGIMDSTFGRDPLNDTILFMVRVPLHSELAAEGLAQMLDQFAQQVRDWKENVLTGQLIDYEKEFERMFPDQAADGLAGAGGTQ
jgi:hypothetical protein